MTYENTLAFAQALDRDDPLRHFRDRFHIPQRDGQPLTYLCGNSLGLQPKSARAALEQELTTSHFNMANIKNIPLVLPDINEQAEIVAYLDTETVRIDDTIRTVEQEIGLLAEYRSALISEVVTGKMRVV